MANEASLLIRIKQVGAEVLDKISDGIETIGKVAFVVGTGIATFGAAAVRAFKESEQASNELNQAMVQQGVYTKKLRQEYDAFADSLSQTSLYQDEQITSATAVLQAQIGQHKVTKELMQATLDLAAAKKMDLASAAELVGKTIGGENNALARQGIELDNVRDKSARTAEVIQKLNGKFGGQAEAATQGLGALEMLKKAGSEFLEAVGERLAPVVGGIASKLLEFVNGIRASEDAMNGIMSVFQATAQIGIVLKGTFEVVGKVIGNVLGGIAGGLAELFEGNFKNAMNQAKSIVTVTMDDTKEVWAKGKEEMKYIDDLFLQGLEENHKKEQELLAQNEIRKLEIKKEHAQLDKEFFMTKNAEELEQAALFEQIRQDADAMAKLKDLNNTIAHSKNKLEVLQAQTQKEKLMKDQQAKLDVDRQTGLAKVEAYLNSEKVRNMQTTLGTISSLQNSNSKELVAIGKAAAMAQAIMNTAQGVTMALGSFPPPVNFVMAGLVGVAGAAQIATIAGTKLAEGGVVKATPGGVPAIIGEGGRDEAVIPLEDGQIPGGGGGGMVVHFHGPFLGSDEDADKFAKVLDKAFLRLRQQNASVAFESDIF